MATIGNAWMNLNAVPPHEGNDTASKGNNSKTVPTELFKDGC